MFYTCCSCYSMMAQQALYQTITIRDGLPSDYVTSMHFDKSGIFWIGTDKGLCRYDGSTMQILNADNGLPGNLINLIFEDTNGDLYVGLPKAGLYKINYKAQQFTISKPLMDSLNISACVKDKEGFFWITAPGDTDYSVKLYRTPDLQIKPELVARFSNCWKCFGIDSTGTIWHNSAILPDQINKTISIKAIPNISKSNKVIDHSIFLHKNFIGTASSTRAAIYTSHNNGLNRINLSLPHNGWEGATYFKSSKYHTFSKGGLGMLIFQDSSFVEWIGDLKFDEIFFMKCIAEDAYGNLYISNFGKGIIVWKGTYLRQVDIGQTLRRLAVYHETTFFNTENNAYIATNGLQTLKKIDNNENLLIHFCSTDSTGNLFLTGYGNTLKAGNPTPAKGFGRDLSDIAYHKGYYYQSSYSNGLLRSKNGVIDTSWNLNKKLPTTIIERIYIHGQNLFAYTLNKGLIKIDLNTLAIKTYDKSSGLLSNSVYEAFSSSDTLYAGTNDGLNVIVNNEITTYTAANGLEGTKVVAVFKDTDNRVWVLSDKYLHQFVNGALFAIRSHPILLNDKSYITTAKYSQATNKLWIGINTGALVVAMDKIIPNQLSYPIKIYNVAVGSRLIANNQYLNFSINHGHDVIQINLAQPHYSAYTRPVLLARLNGYDTTWMKIAPNGKLLFNKLPEGNYSLEVQSIGPDLGKVDPYVILSFNVLPPWWKQGWFISITLLVLAALAYVISRSTLKRVYKRRLEKAEAETALQLERSRISRELHDNVGSMLTVIINRIDDEQEDEKQNHTVSVGTASIARNTLSQLRDTIWALDSAQLSAAQWNTRSISFLQTLQVPFHHQFQWPESLMLSPTEALNSFRILQEACNNAIKHGHPKQMVIKTGIEKNILTLIIMDDGRGFDPNNRRKGMGLRNMQRRAAELNGALQINSNVNGGTSITLVWQSRQQSTL